MCERRYICPFATGVETDHPVCSDLNRTIKSTDPLHPGLTRLPNCNFKSLTTPDCHMADSGSLTGLSEDRQKKIEATWKDDENSV
jgi:hypothetical protein